MKKITLLISIVFYGCQPHVNQHKELNLVTVKELIANKGKPKTINPNLLDAKVEMYEYENQEVYQVVADEVMTRFREPKFHERHIQYWRHLLKDKFYKIERVEADEGHIKFNKLECNDLGLFILFNQSGTVVRIAEKLRVTDEN